MQVRSRIAAREFKSGDRPDLYEGTLPLEALHSILLSAAKHRLSLGIMHIDVSRAYFHAKAQRPLLVRLPAEDQRNNDAGELDFLKKNMYDTLDAASNWACGLQNHLKRWDYKLGQISKKLCHHRNNKISRMTHGDDSAPKLIEVMIKVAGSVAILAQGVFERSTSEVDRALPYDGCGGRQPRAGYKCWASLCRICRDR